jgi:Dolichyl-phosphate-mannose-protein mannosyltransferase
LNFSTFKTLLINPWIVGAITVAFLLRIFRLDAAAIWLDETFTATWVVMPWQDMLAAALGDNHLPLYFIIVKAWTLIAGDSPWALRFVSVVFSCATVPVVAAIAFTLSGRSAALWAAWLTALSPFLIHHGQEARMYPLLAFLAAINLLLLARFVTHKSERLSVGYLLTNVAMLATHYYAVFVIAVTFPILFILARERWRQWAPMLILGCVFSVGPILAARYLATPVAGGNYQGIGLIGLPGMVWGLLSGYTLMPSSNELHRLGLRAIAPFIPIVALGLGVTGIVLWFAVKTASKPAWILLLGVVAGVLLGPLAIASVFEITINPRYATAGAPAFITLLAIGLTSLTKHALGRAVTLALLTFFSGASIAHLLEPGHGREDIFAATKWLDLNVGAEEEIYFASKEFSLLSNYHWPHRRFIAYPEGNKVVKRDNVQNIARNLPVGTKHRTILMLARDWISDPNDLLVPALRNHFEDCGGINLRGIRILCLRKNSSAISNSN